MTNISDGFPVHHGSVSTSTIDHDEIARAAKPGSAPIPFHAAAGYADRGWNVFPLHHPGRDELGNLTGRCSCGKESCGSAAKHPMTARGFKDSTRDPKQIEQWWQKQRSANIGIATGQASGLVVLDVDPAKGGQSSLANLLKIHGPLPQTVHVVTGTLGSHYYFKHPGQKVPCSSDLIGAGLDIRGDGGYVVGACSQHICGNSYDWAAGHSPDDVAVAELPAWLLDRAIKKPHRPAPGAESSSCSTHTETIARDVTESTERIEAISVNSVLSVTSIEEIIASTQPGQAGARNACLMELARGLKFNAGMAAAAPAELEVIVKRWHAKAMAIIDTKAFTETWADFLHAFRRARVPLGASVEVVMKTIDRTSLPKTALRYDSEPVQLFVALCIALVHMNNDNGRFFLSSHDAARELGVKPAQVFRWVYMLEADRLLEIVKKGVPRGPATRYRWLADTE